MRSKKELILYDDFADENVVDEEGKFIKLIFAVNPPDEVVGKIHNEFYLSENKDGERFKDFNGSESFVGKRRFCKRSVQKYEGDFINCNEENNRVDKT